MTDNKLTKTRREGEVINLSKSYIIEEKLGTGGFSTVYRVRDKKGRSFALKEIEPYPHSDAGIPCLFEASIMSSYRHPNLNRSLEINILGDNLYIVQELALSTLYEWAKNRLVSDSLIIHIINRLAQGLNFFHSNNIIHGDVKATNVLVFPATDEEFGVVFKLSDFNLTSFKHWDSDIPVCTSSYRPLEAWREVSGQWDEKIDIWGLGCVAYYLKYGEALFKSQNKDKELYSRKQYLNALYDWEKAWYSHVSPQGGHKVRRNYYKVRYYEPYINELVFQTDELHVCIANMLCPYPEGRPSADEILETRVVKKRYKTAQYGSFKRVTPLEAKILPPLTRRPKDLVVADTTIDKASFLPRYTKDENIADVATHIYSRFVDYSSSPEETYDVHALKTAVIWISSKLVRKNHRCDEAPPVDPLVSLYRLRELEKDICRRLNFVLH